ncbi:MAG TPA: VOC family protein [Mycobacteriales bacterium]|nr:VOC family protein [Mycobacteriales bacterium]
MFRDVLTTLYCADLDASLRFYRDRLGFRESFRYPREGLPLHVELRLGGAVIALSTLDAIAAYGLPASRGEPFELAVGAADTDAAVAALRAAGVPVRVEPMVAPNGQRVAYVADPDGNRVRIWS